MADDKDKHGKHEREKDESFRVIDRRLFTEQGELRPEAVEQARRDREAAASAPAAAPAAGPASSVVASGAAAPAASASAGAGGATSGTAIGTASGTAGGTGASGSALGVEPGGGALIGGEAPARSPHFEMLVNLIANQAAAMMGAYADPQTGQAVVDLEGAREFIDMLDALREKTRGNLASEEDRTLTEVLGSLKYTFLEMTKAAAARVSGVAPKPGARR